MAERNSKSKATPRRRKSTPKKVAEKVKVEAAPEVATVPDPELKSTPEPKPMTVVIAPRNALKELPEELSPLLDEPVLVTLVQGSSYRDRLTKAIFLKGRPLPITNRALAERCRQSSRFKVGGAR